MLTTAILESIFNVIFQKGCFYGKVSSIGKRQMHK